MVQVNAVVPPTCLACDQPLTDPVDLRRSEEDGLGICGPCMAIEETACWCSYGWCLADDPRQFEPDEENTPEESARWRAACEAWARGEREAIPAEEHGPWVSADTGAVTIGARPEGVVVGVCSAPRSFGMGTSYCPEHRAADNAWRGWPRKHGEAS